MGESEPSSEEHRIDDQIDDGGGCVEAWKTMSDLRDGDSTTGTSVNRRAAIKILGGSAASIPAIGTVAAQPDSKSDDDYEFNPTTVRGDSAQSAIDSVLNSTEFDDIRDEIRSEESYSFVKSDPSVLQMSDRNGKEYLIVTFSLKPSSSSVEKAKFSDASFVVRNGKVVYSKAAIFFQDDHQSSSNTASTASATETEFLIHGTGYTSNGGSIKSNTSEAVVSTSSGNSQPTGAVQANSVGCDACTLVGDAVCAVGCGIGISAACAGTAIASLPVGASCQVIATAFCSILTGAANMYAGAGCTGDVAIQVTCGYAGYC